MEVAMSYKVEVIADSSGKWAGNQLRFATRKEAEAYGSDLAMRWTLVRETRVVESDEPVTHAFTRDIFDDGSRGSVLMPVKEG
jgi:hypothetical protein